MNAIPDEELLQRAGAGDAEAFETLYRRHRDRVYRLASRFTGNEPDALDVLQEAFLYLLRKCPGLHLTASLTTFLYPAVKHLALNLRRRRHPATDEEILLTVPDPATTSTPRAELAAALAGLAPEQREVVLLRFVDDMTLDEIATALDVPTGTIKSRLHRALETLRQDPRTRDYFLA